MSISKNAIIAKTAIIHENVIIEDGVVLHDYVVVYPNTVIKHGTEVFDHCVLGKVPKSPGCTAREIKDSFDTLVIGDNCILCPHVTLYPGTTIGSHTLLGDNASIREDCRIGDYCIISRNVSVNYCTTIGEYTKIMDNTHITGNMIIGNHVFISVLVATTNDNSMGKDGYNDGDVTGPCIEDYVTVGAAANILPHVHIGKNSVVGAGSVVTKDVPEGKIVMGVPARIKGDAV